MRRTIVTCLGLLLASLVAVGCGQFGKTYTGSSAKPSNTETTPSITDKQFTAAERKEAGCGEIEDLPDLGNDHVDTPVKYTENPPASDNHNPVPLDWGVYDDEQKTERWVHNLEHGHVVVLHKGLSKSEVGEIKAARDKSPYHLLIIPRKANPKDGVYIMAWRHRLYCKDFSEAALEEMRELYLDQGPELLTNDPMAEEK